MEKKPKISYADAGVDINAGNAFVRRIKNAVEKTMRNEVIGGIGGFGALFRADFAGLHEPVLVSSTDGVGTKILLLQKHQKHYVAGIDVVAMCVNDVAAQGAQPLFFLDYLACGRLEMDVLAEVVEGIANACKQCGCALVGGETAEMPGMYEPGHYDLAGFCVGVVERKSILDGSRIREGDAILGLASSGPHANGFSLIRKLIAMQKIDLSTQRLEDGTLFVDALLEPTKLYVAAVQKLLAADVRIHGLAHITGGGLFDNIERILPKGLSATLMTKQWPIPPVFDYLFSLADIPKNERFRTFNMGIGYVVILPEDQVANAMRVLQRAGEAVYSIGYIHSGGEPVRLI